MKASSSCVRSCNCSNLVTNTFYSLFCHTYIHGTKTKVTYADKYMHDIHDIHDTHDIHHTWNKRFRDPRSMQHDVTARDRGLNLLRMVVRSEGDALIDVRLLDPNNCQCTGHMRQRMISCHCPRTDKHAHHQTTSTGSKIERVQQ